MSSCGRQGGVIGTNRANIAARIPLDELTAAMVKPWRMMAICGMLALASSWATVAVAAPGVPNEALCAAHIGELERQYDIPTQLLNAISVVESGRYNRESKATLAWPWTVTAEGEGKYFPSKDEAVAEVKRLKARGIKNIDVGCMQVNLHYHPKAFTSLEDAFDPASNIGYAARFLKGLFTATNHWITAASYYHSQTPSLAAAYRERLMKVWNGGNGQPAIAAMTPRLGLPGLPSQPTLKPKAPGSQQVEDMRQAWRNQQMSTRDEARRIADAYRQARLTEYQMRRARMGEARRAVGLPVDGY